MGSLDQFVFEGVFFDVFAHEVEIQALTVGSSPFYVHSSFIVNRSFCFNIASSKCVHEKQSNHDDVGYYFDELNSLAEFFGLFLNLPGYCCIECAGHKCPEEEATGAEGVYLWIVPACVQETCAYGEEEGSHYA